MTPETVPQVVEATKLVKAYIAAVRRMERVKFLMVTCATFFLGVVAQINDGYMRSVGHGLPLRYFAAAGFLAVLALVTAIAWGRIHSARVYLASALGVET